MKPKEMTRAGLLFALGLVLPSLFHLTGMAGPVFLPIHIPALVGGFVLENALPTLLVGFLLPLANFFITGMPPFPLFPVMMVELAVYGLLTWYGFRMWDWGILKSLGLAMLAGRAVSFLGQWFVLSMIFGRLFSPAVALQALFITGLPGIAIQLVLIPLLLKGVHVAKHQGANH